MNKRRTVAFAITLLFVSAGALRYISLEPSLNRNIPREKVVTEIKNRDMAITNKLKTMSLRELVAAQFIFHFPGTDANQIKQFIDAYRPGGVILMGDNIPSSTEELFVMTQVIKGTDEFPPLIAIDQEGGTVKRITDDAHTAGIELAHLPASETQKAFIARSELLASTGITLNFGIVADVTNDKNSFIYPRVIGTDAASSSERVRSAVLASKGKTYSTLKHFPGHGGTPEDSHLGIPSTDETIEQWRRSGKSPFVAGINAGAEFVMMGHLRYTSIDRNPASVSKEWYGILKNELGFKGVMITDDMFMLADDPDYGDLGRAAAEALMAGATMLLYVTENGEATAQHDPLTLISYVTSKVESGQIDRKIVERNARKVLKYQYDSRELSR